MRSRSSLLLPLQRPLIPRAPAHRSENYSIDKRVGLGLWSLPLPPLPTHSFHTRDPPINEFGNVIRNWFLFKDDETDDDLEGDEDDEDEDESNDEEDCYNESSSGSGELVNWLKAIGQEPCSPEPPPSPPPPSLPPPSPTLAHTDDIEDLLEDDDDESYANVEETRKHLVKGVFADEEHARKNLVEQMSSPHSSDLEDALQDDPSLPPPSKLP